jgi:N-dimethylarginine dimethylaminohydrolase
MLRLLIAPTTFEILPMQHGQNPYIATRPHIQNEKAATQHKALATVFEHRIICTLPDTKVRLPDIVFVANGGLALPRLRAPLVLLPNMKFAQRKAELPFLRDMFRQLGIPTMDYPGSEPFEGQAELKWFAGGTKAIGGYGFRSTKKSFDALKKLFKKIYQGAGLEPPEILAVPLESADYYHLDVAMLEFGGDRCIVHKRAFSPASIKKMRDFLGGAGAVQVIDVADSFCLNSVIDGDTLITHILDAPVKKLLEELTGKTVQQVDTSEFEKSGGSVRCMNLDVF